MLGELLCSLVRAVLIPILIVAGTYIAKLIRCIIRKHLDERLHSLAWGAVVWAADQLGDLRSSEKFEIVCTRVAKDAKGVSRECIENAVAEAYIAFRKSLEGSDEQI